jgi:hypothetical protein
LVLEPGSVQRVSHRTCQSWWAQQEYAGECGRVMHSA